MSMQLHRQAESYMAQAETLETEGRSPEARALFCRAAEKEAQVFARIPSARQKTRGIVALSVVSLFWRAGELDEAIRYADRYLSLRDLPEWAEEELGHLLYEIHSGQRARSQG